MSLYPTRSIPPKHPTDTYWTCPRDEERNFEAVGHCQQAKAALRTHFNRTHFLPRQLAAINVAVGCYDLILSLPTSAGKSLCYQLPAILDEDHLTIVISPTRALIEDQIKNLRALGESWETWAIRSHSDKRQDPRQEGARLFYVCPEWADNPKNQAEFTFLCEEGRIGRIIIDEAHQALRAPSQSGNHLSRNDRRAYAWVFEIREHYPRIPITLVSASTTDRDLRKLTDRFDMTGRCVRVSAPLDRSNLHYRVVHVPKTISNYRIRAIVAYIKNHPNDCGLIFVRTRKQAQDIAQKLFDNGIDTDYFHGGQRERLHEILQKFHSGSVKVIVCTCAFGEGINKADVRFVFHYSIPPNIQSYFQETGRAGRDGLRSECILFYRFSDIRTIANIIAHDTPQGERRLISTQKDDLQRVITYCNDSLSCRRSHILDPFQDDYIKEDWLRKLHAGNQGSDDCEECDVCQERLSRSQDESFETITEKYLEAVDNAFRNDFELSVPTLASRVPATEGINTTSRHAEEIIEYLAAAGYLSLQLQWKGRGFVTTVKPRARESDAYRPIPIPYDIDLEPARSVAKPRARRSSDEKLSAIKGGDEVEEFSEDELTPAESDREDVSSDEEIQEVQKEQDHIFIDSDSNKESPLIMSAPRTRKRRRSTDSLKGESPKRQRNGGASVDALVKKFKELVKRTSMVKQDLREITDSTLRGMLARHWEYLDSPDRFRQVLKEIGASQEEIESLSSWFKWIEDEVLHGQRVLKLIPRYAMVENL